MVSDNGTVIFEVGGRTYTFAGDSADAMRGYPWDREPHPAEPGLHELHKKLGRKNSATGTGAGTQAEPGEVIGEGRRDATLTSKAGAMRRAGFGEEAIYAALEVVNREQCDPPLDDDQVRKIAKSVARYAPDDEATVKVKAAPIGGEGPEVPPDMFPAPIPATRLQHSAASDWLWHGYLARGSITLLSALWKAGKTTLLAHLLKQLEFGGAFCGLKLDVGKVLYVTEESENRWAERRDSLTLRDNVEFVVRPFKTKPDGPMWARFLQWLKAVQRERQADLVVLDPLSNLWPVRDENDAPQVQAALMPLHEAFDGAAGLLVHHNRKGDGQEATAARGSGALSAFVDTIVELRRYEAGNRKDRRRVLTAYGRHDETPAEVVVELTPEGFVSDGDRQDISRRDLRNIVVGLLPGTSPGLTTDQIEGAWPEEHSPRRERLVDVLRHGSERHWWVREGTGKRGSPFTYWRAS